MTTPSTTSALAIVCLCLLWLGAAGLLLCEAFSVAVGLFGPPLLRLLDWLRCPAPTWLTELVLLGDEVGILVERLMWGWVDRLTDWVLDLIEVIEAGADHAVEAHRGHDQPGSGAGCGVPDAARAAPVSGGRADRPADVEQRPDLRRRRPGRG